MGAAFVTVVHRAGEDVDAILSSARRVAVDHHGCATTAPSSTARPAAPPAPPVTPPTTEPPAPPAADGDTPKA